MAVLVVDDNPQSRAVAVGVFKSLGLAVVDAMHGEHALRVLMAHPEVDLLFADVLMPGMKCADLVAEAKRLRPDLKITLTSGSIDPLPMDFSDIVFIRKPWRTHEIASLLRSTRSGAA